MKMMAIRKKRKGVGGGREWKEWGDEDNGV